LEGSELNVVVVMMSLIHQPQEQQAPLYDGCCAAADDQT
jgi:hypothetical protein